MNDYISKEIISKEYIQRKEMQLINPCFCWQCRYNVSHVGIFPIIKYYFEDSVKKEYIKYIQLKSLTGIGEYECFTSLLLKYPFFKFASVLSVIFWKFFFNIDLIFQKQFEYQVLIP